MNLKRITAVLCALLFFVIRGASQYPTYSFNTTSATATESNSVVIAGYVRASIPPATDDSVHIALTAGAPRPTHMDPTTSYVIHFPAGQDSVAFSVTLYDDTFPEYTEHVIYALQTYGTLDTIGTDNAMDFILLDNDVPATISYVLDTDTAYILAGTAQLCETVNNPNNFYIRYLTKSYNIFSGMGLTAYPGGNFNYYPDTIYAPPGISTICQTVYIVADTFTNPPFRTFEVALVNLDANTLVDSTSLVYIVNDNIYHPPTISFDYSGITVVKDTAVVLRVPMTTINPNHFSISYLVDTFLITTTSNFNKAIQYHLGLGNNYFINPAGTWHDTLIVSLFNDHLINDTTTVTLRIKGVTDNLSPDTLFAVTVIDTGSLVVSFVGAGFAHLKDDSVGYVQVYTSAPVKYPVTAYISYLNGDAVSGVDYLWTDTTVTFPPDAFDTISLPVFMLKNHIHNGNKQVNLQLTNVIPSSVQVDIRQYTYTIIDNDSTAAYPDGVTGIDNSNIVKVYPNPFSSDLTIHSTLMSYQVSVTNMMGENISTLTDQSGDTKINLAQFPTGLYLLRISDSDRSYVKLLTKM